MNEEMGLEYICLVLRLVGFIFGIISLWIEIGRLDTDGGAVNLEASTPEASYFLYIKGE